MKVYVIVCFLKSAFNILWMQESIYLEQRRKLKIELELGPIK